MSTNLSFNSLQKFDFVTIFCTSLAFVVSLSWNNLFQNLINYYFPDTGSALIAQSFHTIILTVLISIFIYYLIKYQDIIMPHLKPLK